jgi:hypothetical protein
MSLFHCLCFRVAKEIAATATFSHQCVLSLISLYVLSFSWIDQIRLPLATTGVPSRFQQFFSLICWFILLRHRVSFYVYAAKKRQSWLINGMLKCEEEEDKIYLDKFPEIAYNFQNAFTNSKD